MGDFNFENRNISVTSLPGSPAQDGTDVTGVSQQTGGAGIRGWLSGIYNLLFSGNAKVQLTGSITGKGALANVTTVGTRVQLPSFACREVTITAKRTNTGYIYASPDNLVSSAVYGIELSAKDSFTFTVANTNQIWIDASVSGEGISYVAL